jgi:hypothetical protein
VVRGGRVGPVLLSRLQWSPRRDGERSGRCEGLRPNGCYNEYSHLDQMPIYIISSSRWERVTHFRFRESLGKGDPLSFPRVVGKG